MTGLIAQRKIEPLLGEIYANDKRTLVVTSFARHNGLILRKLSFWDFGARIQDFIVSETLVSDRYFLSDLEKYPAARRALIDLELLLSIKYGRSIYSSNLEIDYEEDLRKWRDLYSFRGKAYKYLNQTLDTANDDPAIVLLPLLALTEVHRALQCASTLRFLLLAQAQQAGLYKIATQRRGIEKIGTPVDYVGLKISRRTEHIVRLLQTSSLSQISASLAIFAIYKVRKISPHILTPSTPLRAAASLEDFFQYLFDYLESRPRTLFSQTRKSLAWHQNLPRRTRAERELSYVQQGIDLNAPLPMYPFAMPKGNWRYLSTPKDILDEGLAMKHCADFYVNKALSTECFLFHYTDGITEATVEYDPMGNLIQAQGPGNCKNSATRDVERLFTKITKS